MTTPAIPAHLREMMRSASGRPAGSAANQAAATYMANVLVAALRG